MNLGEAFNKLNKIYEAKERLNESEKINIPDYDQESEIDGYVIVYDDGDKLDSHPDDHLLHHKYLKKDGERQLFPKLDELSKLEERNHGGEGGEGSCLIDVSTDNLIESERYDTVENAGKALERLINKLYDIDWPIELHKIKDDKYEIEFDFLDVSGFGTGYSIKPLIFKRTAYLELEEKFTEENNHEDQLVEGKKIYIPDYDQHPSIDSYVIEVTSQPDIGLLDGEYYLKKGGDDEEDWGDYFTVNLEEAERFDSIESARKDINDILFNDEVKYKGKNKQHLRASYNDNDGDEPNDEEGIGTDFRIKALYAHKTVYLEVED